MNTDPEKKTDAASCELAAFRTQLVVFLGSKGQFAEISKLDFEVGKLVIRAARQKPLTR